MRMQKLTKHLYWRRWAAVKSYNAPSHQKYMPCWGMSNGRWRIFRGGSRDKMEDWVECLHQWGMQQRRQFWTVQDPLVRTLAREKFWQHPSWCACSSGCDGHGEQAKIVREKGGCLISTRLKLQQDVGRFQAIKYFIDTKEETLPWVEVLFNDGEVDLDSQNTDRMENSWARISDVRGFFWLWLASRAS